MAFTRERLHDSSKIFVEQARCLLLGYSFYPRPNSNALGTAVVVITSGLTITDASTRKTSLIRENKIDWFRSLGCGGFKNLTRSRKPTFHLLDQEEDKRKLCSKVPALQAFALPTELTRRHNDTRFYTEGCPAVLWTTIFA